MLERVYIHLLPTCLQNSKFLKVNQFSQPFSRVLVHEISDKTSFRSHFDLAFYGRLTTDIIPKTFFLINVLIKRKKELLPFATAWMELENIMLSEISQVVKDI